MSTTTPSTTITTTYAVSGMSCDHCSRAVAAEVGQIVGVRDVAVVVATGTLTVTSDRPLAREVVAAAVDEAGYQLA